jgi:hypothetical protein
MDRLWSAEPIERYFARFTGYLTAGEIYALADCYNYPALAVTARRCLAITEPQQSRDFFDHGQVFYRSREPRRGRRRGSPGTQRLPGGHRRRREPPLRRLHAAGRLQ